MRISVIGTGYVGLVSGTCLAELGHDVICVDVDEAKVDAVNRGETPIFEPGLEELLRRNAGARLRATTDLAAAVRESELSMIAVGTPFDGERIDLRYIRAAARQIGEALRGKDGFHTIVVKSTVVPGTTDDVVAPAVAAASGKRAGEGFGVGMNPEFLREGAAVQDFMAPDRIVLGASDARAAAALRELYAVFPDADVLATTPRSAEMIKYAANSLLATLISFSNEIANLCAVTPDVDVAEVMRGVHLDKRFMPIGEDGARVRPGMISYLEAGCGFGGSCFPKDVKALAAYGRELKGAATPLLDAVLDINATQPDRMLELLEAHEDLDGLPVTVLGLAFKPDTDDVRESPSLTVIRRLADRGARVTAYDPVATHEAQRALAGVEVRYAGSLDAALEGSRAVLLMTRWAEFERLPEALRAAGSDAVVVDGRRMLEPGTVERYEGIGRAPRGRAARRAEPSAV